MMLSSLFSRLNANAEPSFLRLLENERASKYS